MLLVYTNKNFRILVQLKRQGGKEKAEVSFWLNYSLSEGCL